MSCQSVAAIGIEMENEYSETFFLSAGEVNAEQELSLMVLTAKIIDVATAHANRLGIGNATMTSFNGGWVLSRLSVELEDYPRVNDTYTLTTWVESWNRHFSERAFLISGSDGHVYGYARTVWMVIDTVTRAGVSLDRLPFDMSMAGTRECPMSRQARHRLPAPDEVAPRRYTFKYCDLDSYRHVNTVRYLVLLLNSFTLEDFDAAQVSRFELSFMREARYGMSVDILRADEGESSAGVPERTSLALVDCDGGLPLLSARFCFRRRELGGLADFE